MQLQNIEIKEKKLYQAEGILNNEGRKMFHVQYSMFNVYLRE